MTMNGPLPPGYLVLRHCSQWRKLLVLFILLSCFVFQKNVPRMLPSPPHHVFLLLSLTYTDWLTANLLEGPGAMCVGAGSPVPLVSPAAFSCSPESPQLVFGQALEGGFPFWTLELCPGGGTQPPGQPLRFLERNWMPWSLGSAAPGARAIVACVGTGWHAAAS